MYLHMRSSLSIIAVILIDCSAIILALSLVVGHFLSTAEGATGIVDGAVILFLGRSPAIRRPTTLLLLLAALTLATATGILIIDALQFIHLTAAG